MCVVLLFLFGEHVGSGEERVLLLVLAAGRFVVIGGHHNCLIV